MTPEHKNALIRLGVTAPEGWTDSLSDEAVAGVITWARDEGRRGKAPTSSQVALKLKYGGLEGYGLDGGDVRAWYRSSYGRQLWMDAQLPSSIDPVYAEAAIISLIAKNREPNSTTVKALAFQLEREQDEHEALTLAGRDRGGTSESQS